jgi:hypothetical protein
MSILTGRSTHGCNCPAIPRSDADAGDGWPGRKLFSGLPFSAVTLSFGFHGRSGARYRLQESTNLQSWQDWRDVSTYSDGMSFTDVVPPAGPRAFYRALDEHGGTSAVHPIAIPDRTITMRRFANEGQPCAGNSGRGVESGSGD